MTKTWTAVLAAVLAATAWPLHAAEPPQFLNLPPTEIKYTYTPPATLPPASTPATTYGPACTTPATPAPACPASACHDSWLSGCWFSGCLSGCSLNGLGERLHDLKPAPHDNACWDKFKGWICYHAHWTGCECCCWCRPQQPGYTYFLYLGCREGNCGGCCGGGCKGTGCGGCASGACSGCANGPCSDK